MGGGIVESALRAGGRAEGLKLIETLGWDGAHLVRVERHLARLERSAAALGWGCDRGAAHAALEDCCGDAPLRLRLTLDRTGRIEVTSTPLAPVTGPWRLGLAGDRLRSDDPWLPVKTTRRAAYDRARAALPPGIDEVVFLNERGEVCDGTITTVFFDDGSGLCTPPLASGLLPGILREELIAAGAREKVLRAEDLPHCALWVGNSLRGLVPARWGPAS
ncbi:MAG: aminotransferase class IV family protein [Rubellimicrobium sp.]|nr:aminotransferase class IV family protein [Rubellimicrobium sp.]